MASRKMVGAAPLSLSPGAWGHRCAGFDDRKLTNFLGDGIDIAIRYGGGKYPGLTSEFLTGRRGFPVCSPKLMKGRMPLRKPEDLRHHTLIRDTYPIDWAAWLSSAGVKGVTRIAGLPFDSYTFAVEAAVKGEGVVLGRTCSLRPTSPPAGWFDLSSTR